MTISRRSSIGDAVSDQIQSVIGDTRLLNTLRLHQLKSTSMLKNIPISSSPLSVLKNLFFSKLLKIIVLKHSKNWDLYFGPGPHPFLFRIIRNTR